MKWNFFLPCLCSHFQSLVCLCLEERPQRHQCHMVSPENDRGTLKCFQWHFGYRTTKNQRLQSAGDNDRRLKRFCSNAVLRVDFTNQMVKTHVIRQRGVEVRNARDQIAFCSFHSFLVEVQTNTWHACVITTWRLGLWAPLIAHNDCT